MTVYVDNMRARYGRMVMCHLLADTDEELHAMADKIGVDRRWHQKPGTAHSHYDVCLSKRAAAIAAGAVEIDRRGVGQVIANKRLAMTPPDRVEHPTDTSRLIYGHPQDAPTGRPPN